MVFPGPTTSTAPSASHHRPTFIHASSSYTALYSRPPPALSDLQPCPYSYLPHDAPPLPASPSISRADGFPCEKHDALPSITVSPPEYEYASYDAQRPLSPDHPRHAHLYGARRAPPTPSSDGWPSRAQRAVSARFACREPGLARWLFLGWCVTTVLFILASAFWRGELFAALDELSSALAGAGLRGQAVFAALILLTTVPPLPLYSTLVVVSGYTFGALPGFALSYLASLAGAVLVFGASRAFFRPTIERSLAASPTATALLSLLHERPSLLLMVRVAPYPYNLLNVLLASSPVSLGTYTACTALSLCKLILHTWIGAGIRDLSGAYGHGHPHRHGEWDGDWDGASDGEDWDVPPTVDQDGAPRHPHPPHHGHHFHHGPPGYSPEDIKFYSTIAGIALCIALFVYITRLTRKTLESARQEQASRGPIALEDSCRETV